MPTDRLREGFALSAAYRDDPELLSELPREVAANRSLTHEKVTRRHRGAARRLTREAQSFVDLEVSAHSTILEPARSASRGGELHVLTSATARNSNKNVSITSVILQSPLRYDHFAAIKLLRPGIARRTLLHDIHGN